MTTKVFWQGAEVDDFARLNAGLMREACLGAMVRRGARVTWDSAELPDDVAGMFTDEGSHRIGRNVLIRPGLPLLTEVVVLAHEVAHCCDPALNHYDMTNYYSNNYDACEAVATYAAYLIAEAYGLLPYFEEGVIEGTVTQHISMKALLADDDLIHRVDTAVFEILPKGCQQAEALRQVRVAEGRPNSGMTTTQRVWGKFRSLVAGD